MLANFLHRPQHFGINLVIPTGSLIFFAMLAFLMWAFLHTKTGTAMTAVGSNPSFAKAAGVSIDKMRLISVVISTWLGAVGILVYEQGFGFIQIYTAPLYMAFPAVSAILIGGAIGQQGEHRQCHHRHVPLPGHCHHDADGHQLHDPPGHQRDHSYHRLQRHDPLRADQKNGRARNDEKNNNLPRPPFGREFACGF